MLPFKIKNLVVPSGVTESDKNLKIFYGRRCEDLTKI